MKKKVFINEEALSAWDQMTKEESKNVIGGLEKAGVDSELTCSSASEMYDAIDWHDIWVNVTWSKAINW